MGDEDFEQLQDFRHPDRAAAFVRKFTSQVDPGSKDLRDRVKMLQELDTDDNTVAAYIRGRSGKQEGQSR